MTYIFPTGIDLNYLYILGVFLVNADKGQKRLGQIALTYLLKGIVSLGHILAFK